MPEGAVEEPHTCGQELLSAEYQGERWRVTPMAPSRERERGGEGGVRSSTHPAIERWVVCQTFSATWSVRSACARFGRPSGRKPGSASGYRVAA